VPGSSANAPTPSKYGGGTSEGDSSEEEDNSVIPSAEHVSCNAAARSKNLSVPFSKGLRTDFTVLKRKSCI
jgi:hypothetical protein